MSPLSYKTNNLSNKIQDRSAKVAIIGLGYVGLPLATVPSCLGTCFARAGYHVTGVDVSARKVEAIKEGHSYITIHKSKMGVR